MIINFLNPTLFVGWLIASFLIISLLTSFGFNTGGLSVHMNNNIKDIQNTEIKKELQEKKDALESMLGKFNTKDKTYSTNQRNNSATFTIILSFIFALMIAIGSTVWFYFFGSFIVHYRKTLKILFINKLINAFGVVFLCIGVYFVYSCIKMIFFK